MTSIGKNPKGFCIDDHEFPPLLRMIDRLAHTRASDTATVEEYRDAGRDGLLSAWQSWQGQVPFKIFAELCITRRMRGTIREYRRWAFPCAPSAPPDAEILTRLIARTMDDTRAESTRELTCETPESTAWLVRDLRRHWPCLSPTSQHALEDFLTEQGYEEIARRDKVTVSSVSSRHTNLMTVLRRHIGARDSSCQEEQGSWKKNLGEPMVTQTPHRRRKNTAQRAYRAANRVRRKQGGAALACAD